MNAADQADIVRRLQASGLEVVRPVMRGASVIDYEPVAWQLVIGHLMAKFQWSVRYADPVAQQMGDAVERAVSTPRTLTLVRATPSRDKAEP